MHSSVAKLFLASIAFACTNQTSAFGKDFQTRHQRFDLHCLASFPKVQDRLGPNVERQVRSNGSLYLSIEGEAGRIFLPERFFSAKKPSDSWYRLTNVDIMPSHITAKIYMSMINKPKVWINRISGDISITSNKMNSFGMCSSIYKTQTSLRF